MIYQVWRSLPPEETRTGATRESRLLVMQTEDLLKAVEAVDSMYHGNVVYPASQEGQNTTRLCGDGSLYTIEAVEKA